MPRQPVNIPNAAQTGLARFVMLATICGVVAAIYFAQDVLIPIALAVLLTFVLAPLVMRLERRKLGRVPSVIIAVTAALALILGIGTVVVMQMQQLINDLPTYQDNIIAKIDRFRPSGSGMFDKLRRSGEVISEKISTPATTQAATQSATSTAPADSTNVPSISSTPTERVLNALQDGARPTALPNKTAVKSETIATATPLGTKKNPSYVVVTESGGIQWSTIENSIGPILSPLATAGIVIVFTIFMLLEREDLRDRLIRLVGQGRLTITTQAISDAGDRISRYLLMQLIINGSYGLIIAIGLYVIGVPNPLLFGLLCSVLRFLPYIGPLIGMSFPIIVSIGKFTGFAKVGETVGLFVLVEMFSNNVMEPWLYGSSTGLSTVAILVSAIFWTWLWGPVGLLLSTPLTVILVVTGKYVPQFAFLDVLLGDEPVLEPHERFYQRLLALDSEEATELAREYRKKESLEHVYGQILLPALSLAERDRHGGLLEPDREKFLHTSMREVIEELGDEERVENAQREAVNVERAAKGLEPITIEKAKPDTLSNPKLIQQRSRRLTLPKDCKVTIVCLPAHDEADELVNLMLSQLLAFAGYCTATVSSSTLASERVNVIETERGDLAVVSALPPSAIAHSRYILKRLKDKIRDERVIVGLWLSNADPVRTRERLSPVDNVKLTTSLSNALDQIYEMAQPVLTEKGAG